MRSIYVGFIVATSLFACSDLPQRDIEGTSLAPDASLLDADNRVPRSSRIFGLSVEDARKLCFELAMIYPSKEVTCDGIEGSFQRGRDSTECATIKGFEISSTCQGTVGQIVECITAQAERSNTQFCKSDPVPACAWLDAC
jgi:hypothetical protein